LFIILLFLIELAASLFTVALPLFELVDIQLIKQWERDYADGKRERDDDGLLIRKE